MPTPPSYTLEDVKYIESNLGSKSYPTIAKERNLSLSCVKRLARDIKKNQLTEPSEPNQVNRTEPSEPNQVNRTDNIIKKEEAWEFERTGEKLIDGDFPESSDSKYLPNLEFQEFKEDLKKINSLITSLKSNYHKLTNEVEEIHENIHTIFDFPTFMRKLDLSYSFAAQHLKEKLNVKGKYRNTNRERIIRVIRDILDVINE